MIGWLGALAFAGDIADGGRCLQVLDVPCAEAIVARLDGDDSVPALALKARTAFYTGRFEEAHRLLDAAVAGGLPDPNDDLALYARTRDATVGWTEERRGRYVVAYKPGVDMLLVDEAFSVLERSDRYVAPLLGGVPPGVVRVELYPDAQSFIDASSLSEQDVRTTGVVALSKWSRLLVTSPRVLGRGYGWQDTIAHEYLHLIVSYQSGDETPVWLQEAIAKFLDARWVDGTDRFTLSVSQQGLLADALATDQLVTFEQMHPSFAMLPSAELAALAYAQVATMMDFAFERAGDRILADVLAEIRGGADAGVAVARGAGFDTFPAFEAAWRAWLLGQGLRPSSVVEAPLAIDPVDDVDADPVLAGRRDLARFLRLGDLLATRGHHAAALVEYAKAVSPDEPESPLIANRVARAHLELGRPNEAREVLLRSLELYPEHTLSHKTLGLVQVKLGDLAGARVSYDAARALNPFDPEVQQALFDLASAAGDAAGADTYARNIRILRRGGD
jgi:tetratricopeptide (TPR) repeat protein